MSEHVAVELAGGVLEVRIDRPEKKNALTREMYGSLADALERAARDPAARVVLLTGTGDSFTSGNDVSDFSLPPPEGEKPSLRFLRFLSGAEKPVIAAVNGLAVGIGVTMLLHCDLVYVGEAATFQLPFVDLGLIPEAASSLLLPRLAGHQRASELFLLGRRFDARTAFDIGIANAVLPEGDVARETRELALAVAAKPGAPVRLTKALLKGGNDEVARRMGEEAAIFDRQLKSPEAAEAMAAFRERRKPDFSRFA